MDFRELAEKYKDDYLKDLNTLVSIESVRDKEHAEEGAPFGPKVRNALEAFLEMARRDGFEVQNVDGYAGVVTYGDGEESVGVLGHLDVVPLGDGWTKNPLQVTEEDGYVFGRGVLDDKGPLLAGYYGLKMLKDAGIPLKRKVMIIAGTDEESGMEGMKYYKEHGEIPTMGFTPDADFPVIYGEKGNLHISLESTDPTIVKTFDAGTRPNIVIAKADCVLDTQELHPDLFAFYLATHGLQGEQKVESDGVHIHMEGIPAHGAMPYLGVNAGVHLLNYIGAAYHDRLCADLYELLKDWKGTPENIMKDGVYMGFLTMNPGIITRKDGVFHVLIDIRYPNDTTVEKIKGGFDAACAASQSGIHAAIESAGKPLFVDPESELVTKLMDSYRKYTGDSFTPALTIGGGTYAKMFDNFVAFGPEKPGEEKTTEAFVGGCHQRDEGVKLADLMEAAAVYADAIGSLAG